MSNTPMIEQWLVKAYGWLLGFYPRRFYNEYAEDMRAVFGMTVRAASQDSRTALAKVLVQEFASLPLAIIRQQMRENEERKVIMPMKPTSRSQITFVRWLTRIFGLLAALFWLYVLLRILPGNAQVLPLTIACLATTASILVAWRSERVGGVATIICGLLVALTAMYGTYSYEQAVDQAIGWAVLLAGFLWGFPFLAVGWLFVRIGQTAESAALVK